MSHGIIRSKDVSVRKSPSISATIYPKGYKMQGNDGNIWEIIVDSRGVHRWQKAHSFPSRSIESDLLEKTQKSIYAMKMLLEDDPDYSPELRKKVKIKIEALDEQASEINDQEASESADLLRKFMRESFKYGGRVSRIRQQEQLYRNVMENANTKAAKELLSKRINTLYQQQKTFA